ncbi:unnamed protein product [Calypogeia fissa]
MCKFGSPDQKSAAVNPNFVENEAEGQCQAQLSTEWSDLNVENNGCPELPEDASVEAVVIVNGVEHSDSASPPSAPDAEAEDVELDSAIIDDNPKLARLELEGLPSGLLVTNGIARPAEAPVKDVDTPDSKETRSFFCIIFASNCAILGFVKPRESTQITTSVCRSNVVLTSFRSPVRS